MSAVSACAVPDGTLLDAYRRNGSYADCYTTDIDRTVSHARFVEAFYTTPLFRVERRLLGWFLSASSSDEQARELAAGQRNDFAAWRVEARAENQLLLGVGRTRSWLMVIPGRETTRLYFGSAVVSTGRGMGFGFSALLGFHQLYSRALLAAARSRLS